MAVLADLTEAVEGPSPEVADDPREAEDTFLGVSATALLSKLGIDGFLNNPLIDGLLLGRAANVFDPNLGVGASGLCLSGLGVRDLVLRIAGAGGCIAWTEDRTGFLRPVLAERAWND